MPTLQITDISAILKKIIIPVLQDQMRKESVLYDKIKKNSGVVVANNEVYIAARTGRHSGIYSVAEGTEPKSGKAKYQQPKAAIKYCFGTLEISDQAIEAASRGDVKAIAAILSTEIDALKTDLRMDTNRQYQGAATGKLCLANGAGTASATLNVDGNTAGLDGTEYLAEGMSIVIGSAAAVEISTVNSATQVTLAAARTWADNDVVKKDSADELMGLAGLIDDGDNVATIQNIARSSNTWANSHTDDTAEALSEADMINIYLKAHRYGYGASKDRAVILMGETMFSKYGQLLLSLKKTANLREVLSGGWQGLEFMGGQVGVMLDPDTWDGYVQFVDFDALTIAEMTSAWQWLEADAHGGILKRSGTNRTIWEGTLKYYHQLVAKRFKSMGRLSNKT